MKTAFVIGGTSGIGRELVSHLVRDDYFVYVTGRRQDRLNEIELDFPEKVKGICHDISDEEQTDLIFSNFSTENRPLDLVIVSSGICELNQHLEWNLEKKTIDTNVYGITKVYDTVFNYMRRQGEGHLVGITSIGGNVGLRSCPAYGASKAYQSNYLEALRGIARNEKLAIKITDIQPGFVDTSLARGDHQFWKMPLKKATSQIYAGIRLKRRKKYVTRRWSVIALIIRSTPNWISERI